MIIDDLEGHIDNDGEHAIFTGTFDPPHVGHTEAIRETIQRRPHLASVVVIPNSWDSRKEPIEIGTRIRWLTKTLEEFAHDLSPRIVVCHDLSILAEPSKLDELFKTYRGRIHRSVGSDKMLDEIIARNHPEALITSRPDKRSSAIIRRSIKEGDVDKIRAILARAVLEDILANSYYN